MEKLVALGKCFLYDKKGSLARGQFERALPELNFDQDPNQFKETYYLLGRVCEELGDKAAAEKYYGEYSGYGKRYYSRKYGYGYTGKR